MVMLLLPITLLIGVRCLILHSLRLILLLIGEAILASLIVFLSQLSHFVIGFSSFHHCSRPSFIDGAYAIYLICFISLNFFICLIPQQPRNSIPRMHFHSCRSLPSLNCFPSLYPIFVRLPMVSDVLVSLLSIIASVSSAIYF